jgi:hypothetical protein
MLPLLLVGLVAVTAARKYVEYKDSKEVVKETTVATAKTVATELGEAAVFGAFVVSMSSEPLSVAATVAATPPILAIQIVFGLVMLGLSIYKYHKGKANADISDNGFSVPI